VKPDVQQFFPVLVKENNKGMLAIGHSGSIPVIIESFRERQQQIHTLQLQIIEFKNVIRQSKYTFN